MIQQYKEECYNFFTHHSQNLEYQQRYPKIISRNPQLLVTKCCMILTWKIAITTKCWPFLQMCLCCNYGTIDWWQVTKILKPSHDVHHFNPFKPLELIIQHCIHGTCQFMQRKMHGRLFDSKKIRMMKILSHMNQLIQVASHVNTHRHCWSKLCICLFHQKHKLTC